MEMAREVMCRAREAMAMCIARGAMVIANIIPWMADRKSVV